MLTFPFDVHGQADRALVAFRLAMMFVADKATALATTCIWPLVSAVVNSDAGPATTVATTLAMTCGNDAPARVAPLETILATCVTKG